MNYTYTIISYFRMNKYIYLAKDDKYNKYFCNFFYVYINLQKFLIIKAIKNKKKKKKVHSFIYKVDRTDKENLWL